MTERREILMQIRNEFSEEYTRFAEIARALGTHVQDYEDCRDCLISAPQIVSTDYSPNRKKRGTGYLKSVPEYGRSPRIDGHKRALPSLDQLDGVYS